MKAESQSRFSKTAVWLSCWRNEAWLRPTCRPTCSKAAPSKSPSFTERLHHVTKFRGEQTGTATACKALATPRCHMTSTCTVQCIKNKLQEWVGKPTPHFQTQTVSVSVELQWDFSCHPAWWTTGWATDTKISFTQKHETNWRPKKVAAECLRVKVKELYFQMTRPWRSLHQHLVWLSLGTSSWTASRLVWTFLFLSARLLSCYLEWVALLFICASFVGAAVPPPGEG